MALPGQGLSKSHVRHPVSSRVLSICRHRVRLTMNSLCRALIWNACFLELSDEGVVDADAAIAQMEQMATLLQESSSQEKSAFIAACASEAERLRKEAGTLNATAADFIAALPKSLGIA